MKKLLLLPALAMFACIDTGKETGETEETGSAETDTEETDTEETDTEETDIIEEVTIGFSITWGETDISLGIEHGMVDSSYYWGIAETSGDCLTSEWGC